MRAFLFVAIAVGIAGCSSASRTAETQVPAQIVQTPAAQAAATDPSSDSKIVCREESVTNTRLKNKKVCLTRAEWRAREEAAKDSFRDANRHGVPPRSDGGG
jgi:hypothetical protein